MPLSKRATDRCTPKEVFAAPKPRRVTLGHVRSVFRLLFEVRDLGVSPLAWRRCMVRGLLALIDGATGIAAEAVIPKKAGPPRLLGTVIAGVRDARLVAVYQALMERGGYSFDLRHEGLADRTNTTLIRARQEMAEGRAWRNRPDLDPWRTLGCEYFICSNQYLPNYSCVHLIILTRSARERAFDETERRIVALFHAELGRLWRRTDSDCAPGLPPQLQQTLELLLDGASEGQVVAKLGLSRHTVHDHVKRLYRRFQVNSRAQLLAQLSHAPLIRAPRLCVNLLSGDDDRRFDVVDMTESRPGHQTPAGEPVGFGMRVTQS